MFGRSTSSKNASHGSNSSRKAMAPTVIAEGTHLLGNIVTEGTLDIDGRIEGNVRAHTVTLRPNAKIRGDVMAEFLHVYGEVEGLIKSQNVTLYSSARVIGTIMHESLTVDDGAFIDGKFKRTDRPLAELGTDTPARQIAGPTLDVTFDFDNDNDQPPSEAEIKILENLRLIS